MPPGDNSIAVNNNNDNNNHDVKELQKTAILITAHTLRKVLTYKNNRTNAGTRHRGTINNKDRIAATMFPLGTWFVSGICAWLP